MSKHIDKWQHFFKNGGKYPTDKLVKRLKYHSGKSMDRWAIDLHEAAFQKIDCLECANCCKSIPPIVNAKDAERLAKVLNLSLAEFSANYLIQDEDGDWVMNT